MKKIIFTTLIIGLSVAELFAQSNVSANKQSKQIGQFQWKRTAQDSVNIIQLPFMRDMIFLVPDNGSRYQQIMRGETYIIFPENGNNNAENKKK